MATITARVDVYTRVTPQIIAQLEAGVRPWLKPWNAEYAAGRITRPLRHNGQPYKGINILMLWTSAEEQEFGCPYWLTFQQAKELGGFVRKGEHGSPVVYASTFKKSETTEEGAEVEQEIPFLKQYTVFNAIQCEGLPQYFYQLAAPPAEKLERIERVEAFFAGTKADVRYGGNMAFYAPGPDYVRLPPFESFRDAESHAATLAHELCHWTRHPSRLNRDLGRKKWGDVGYAMEELVAELGAAFLCADLAVTPEVREDHASYIHEWLQALKEDKRAIFAVASHASRAVDFLHGLQPVRSEFSNRPGRAVATGLSCSLSLPIEDAMYAQDDNSSDAPFSLVCRECGVAADGKCHDLAVADGWSGIDYAPHLLAAGFVCLCPECRERFGFWQTAENRIDG